MHNQTEEVKVHIYTIIYSLQMAHLVPVSAPTTSMHSAALKQAEKLYSKPWK